MPVSIQTGSIASWAGTLDSTAPYGHAVPVTVAAGANRLLVVMVGGALSAYTATFNGVAMTSGAMSGSGATTHSRIFYMVNPPVGTFNVSVNDTGWAAHDLTLTAFVLDGVDQTTPLGTPVSAENVFASSPTNTAITSTSNDAVISILSLYSDTNPSIAVTTGTALTAQLSNAANRYSRAQYFIGALSSIGFTFGGSSQQSAIQSYVVNGAAPSGDTIACGLGSGSATGAVASILAAVTIACTLGSASGSGIQAAVTTNSPTTISCARGTAAASGIAAGVSVAGSATITSAAFRNNTGTLLNNTVIAKLAALRLSDMTLAVSWSNQMTNGAGVLALTSGSLTSATDYLLVASNADGSAVGAGKYTAS